MASKIQLYSMATPNGQKVDLFSPSPAICSANYLYVLCLNAISLSKHNLQLKLALNSKAVGLT